MDMNTWGFLAVVAFVVVSAIRAIERIPIEQRAAAGVPARHPRWAAVAWLMLTAVPTVTGSLAPAGPVPPQAVLIPILAVATWLAVSATGRGIAEWTPLWLLIGFQGFRLPLELVLHGWVDSGVAPPQMTWTGSNIDIAAGIVALASMPLVHRWPRFAWLPTVAGMVLLANVISVVLRSLPGPLRTFPETVTLAARFPHVWIATVCVAGALAAHLIAVRALLRPPPPTRRA